MTLNALAEDAQSVLIVDDSELIHRLLAVHLRAEALELTHVTDPYKAVEAAKANRPDLILLDIDMPGLCGDEICVDLKSDTETHDIPIIFLTGEADLETKVRCFDLGAVDYIEKPFAVPELRARVRAALRTKRFLDLLNTRAQIDGLTGLWNRTHFDQRARASVEGTKRYQRPGSLVLLDIDHFKRCNDTYGHPFGDKVIVSVADRIAHSIRETDTACRYGGEEFAILLDDTGIQGAAQLAERLREDIAAIALRHRDEVVKITASFGVSCTHEDGLTEVEAFIKTADERLYMAKRGGRNQVRFAA